MSFWNTPQQVQIKFDSSGPSITARLEDNNEEDCPTQVKEWLQGLGWSVATHHPDTGEPLFRKDATKNVPNIGTVDLTDGHYYRWSEAVAWEMFFFMSIGGS